LTICQLLAKITRRIKYLLAKGTEKCMKVLVEVIRERDQVGNIGRYGGDAYG
jgi:hypothetical protein